MRSNSPVQPRQGRELSAEVCGVADPGPAETRGRYCTAPGTNPAGSDSTATHTSSSFLVLVLELGFGAPWLCSKELRRLGSGSLDLRDTLFKVTLRGADDWQPHGCRGEAGTSCRKLWMSSFVHSNDARFCQDYMSERVLTLQCLRQ